jgi:hypothetical protein
MPAVPPVSNPECRYIATPSATNSVPVTSACASSKAVCGAGLVAG